MSNLAFFDEQINKLVNEKRMKDYGHPAKHFEASAKIKAILRENFKKPGDERYLHILDMIADKMVRLCQSPQHLDSWIDIAGYARTATMVMDAPEITVTKVTTASSGS